MPPRRAARDHLRNRVQKQRLTLSRYLSLNPAKVHDGQSTLIISRLPCMLNSTLGVGRWAFDVFRLARDPQPSIVLLVTRLSAVALCVGGSLITSSKPLPSYFFLLPSYFSLFLRPSAASLSKSSADGCARLPRDGPRNPPKYSRRIAPPPDSPPAGGNANACTSRAMGRDFSGQPVP